MTRTMDLRELFNDPGSPALEVTGIACDSRRVQSGDLFVARRGQTFDGHDFVASAVAAGAVAVVSQRPLATTVPNIVAPRIVEHLGELGARFYGAPSRSLDVVGVTGTNGKTTVAYNIAAAAGKGGKAAYMGTLGWGSPWALRPSALTTDDALAMQARLRTLADNGVGRVAVEVSSHALDQGRIEEVAVDVGVFTNLGRDHLDYHGTTERYAAAKRKLFEADLAAAVVNIDDPIGRALADQVGDRLDLVTVGQAGTVRWTDLRFGRDGVNGIWTTPWGRREFSLPSFFGEFSVYNAACVVAACCVLGDSLTDVVRAMEKLPGVPGRMQRLASSPSVFVDYAHTPEGLVAVLAAIRSHVGHGRVITVFGCGGDRDHGKRPLMALAAETGSEVVVATTDNPRSEHAERILDDVLAGFRNPETVLRIADRSEAIAAALDRAGPDDVVLIAGKGHEDYQEVDGRRLPWSDAAVVNEFLGGSSAGPAAGPRRCPDRRGRLDSSGASGASGEGDRR